MKNAFGCAILLLCLVLGFPASAFVGEVDSGDAVVAFKSPVLDATFSCPVHLPEGAKAGSAYPAAVYAYNGNWPTPGIPEPAAQRDHLLAEGFVVVMLDYGKDERAVMPSLWKDGAAWMQKGMFEAVGKAVSLTVSELIVVPEGYTAKRNVHIYDSPDNDLPFYAMVLYPINPPAPVPLIIRMNNAGSWAATRMGGAEFRGYARAWAGHPFNYDKGRGIFPGGSDMFGKNIAYGKSTIRTFRHHAKAFHIDPGRFGVYGCSKHGNLSVWLAVTGDVPALDQEPPGLYKEESSQVQFLAAEATWGVSEHLAADKAPKDVPRWMGWEADGAPPAAWLLERSWSTYLTPNDPPMALDRCHGGHWRTEQVKRLIRMADEAGISMIQSLDSDLPNYQKNKSEGWLDFADSVLKPSLPIVKTAE